MVIIDSQETTSSTEHRASRVASREWEPVTSMSYDGRQVVGL